MCLYPKLMPNPKYRANKKNGGNIPPVFDERVKQVPIGCGKCIECKKQKANTWRVRLSEEIRHSKGVFVTLTFSTEEYRRLMHKCREESKSLKGYELDNAIAAKGVRYFLENWRKRKKKSVKHWLITEIGGNNYENIHIHGIIFDTDRKTIGEAWRYGYTYGVKEETYVNEKTINYIVKYLLKQDDKHKGYTPIIMTSPGIGKGYMDRIDSKANTYKPGETDERYTNKAGYKVALPIYYRNKIYTEQEREKLWIEKLDKMKRYVLGEEIDITNGEEEYWKALKYAQEKNARIGYGGSENEWAAIQYERELRIQKQMQRLRSSNEPGEK